MARPSPDPQSPARPGAPALLDALDLRPRRDRALSPDGVDWLTVGDLLDGVAREARRAGPGDRYRAAAVSPDDPVTAVRGLLAAQAAGRVPVVGAGSGQPPVLRAAGRLAGGEPLLVVVTSGSGGRPRAVVRTARSWQASLAGFDTLLGPDAGPGTTVWAPGAPAATLTLFGLWHALATGRPAVAPGRWHGGRAAASGPSVTAVQCVPAVLADVLDARAAGLLPALRRAVVAGAAPTPGLRRRAGEAGVGLAEYYGAAELSFVAADPDGRGLRAFPGARVAVRQGVIWVRSPYLSRGYLEPEGPQGVRGALRRDAAGWASVGDLGELSPQGVLTVRGRGDGTATVGGATVTLADVELALGDAPGIAEVIALAEADGRFGERVLAVVRPRGPVDGPAGEAVLVAGLRAVARRELLPAARPVRYVVRDRLPRLAGGKVARAALLAQVGRAPTRTLSS